MPNWTGGIITARGRELQAKVEAGETLVITKMKLGSGTPQAYEMDTLTDLKQPLMEFGISSKTVENNICEVTGVVVSSEIETPFYAREWGLFAQDPDEGEILYMYTTDPNPDFIPAKTAALQISATYALNIVVLNVDNIIVNIDPNGLVTTAILNSELKEYLPLSGGNMTGDITANNVYANNSVLVFNNVEEMKASNKVKAGYTLKTLGFYTAGDGGGAEYVVVDDIGDDEPDDGSIIQLQKNLYAKLIISDYVNVKQFGAYGDGENDDTQAIQNCFNAYRPSNNIGEETILVCFSKGVYKITSPLEIDITYIAINGMGAVIDATQVTNTSGVIQIKGKATNSGHYYNIVRYIKKLIIKGNMNSNTPCFAFITDNIVNTKSGVSRVLFEHLYIKNFYIGVLFGNNTYMETFRHCTIQNCIEGFKFPNGLINSGEKILIEDCVIFGCDIAFHTSTSGISFFVNATSIDFNKQAVVVDGEGEITFSNCHIEWSYLDLPHVVITGNAQASILFFNCVFVQQQIENKFYEEYAFESNNSSYGGLYIHDCRLANIYSNKAVVGGTGYAEIRNCLIPRYSTNPIYGNINYTKFNNIDNEFIIPDTDDMLTIEDNILTIKKGSGNIVYFISPIYNNVAIVGINAKTDTQIQGNIEIRTGFCCLNKNKTVDMFYIQGSTNNFTNTLNANIGEFIDYNIGKVYRNNNIAYNKGTIYACIGIRFNNDVDIIKVSRVDVGYK